MTSTVFFGFGAYVGAIKGLRQVEWWPAPPASLNWDASKLIPTDLDKSPLAAQSGQIQIGDIQVDDHLTNLGLTRIGPRFPQGEMVGAIWLSESYYNSLPANRRPPRHQSTDGADYELTSVLYWNNNAIGRRFFGFRGRIVGPQSNGKIRVDLWHGGRGKIQGEQPKGHADLDFATEVDATNTQISTSGTQDGAIFIEDKTARQLQIMSPKRPESAGFEFFPRR